MFYSHEAIAMSLNFVKDLYTIRVLSFFYHFGKKQNNRSYTIYISIKRHVLKYGIFKCFYTHGNKSHFTHLINGCVSLYFLSTLTHKKKMISMVLVYIRMKKC